MGEGGGNGIYTGLHSLLRHEMNCWKYFKQKKSISKKIDPKLTKRIWKNIIRAYIDFEKKNFKKK